MSRPGCAHQRGLRPRAWSERDPGRRCARVRTPPPSLFTASLAARNGQASRKVRTRTRVRCGVEYVRLWPVDESAVLDAQKFTRSEVPNVRGWFVRYPMRALVPRSWSSARSARSSVRLLAYSEKSHFSCLIPIRAFTMSYAGSFGLYVKTVAEYGAPGVVAPNGGRASVPRSSSPTCV